jgi:hypothetical protein
MNDDVSQLVFVLLFQLGFWLVRFPLPLSLKLLSYAIVDACMFLVIVSEWQRFTVEWEIYKLKVFGEIKK